MKQPASLEALSLRKDTTPRPVPSRWWVGLIVLMAIAVGIRFYGIDRPLLGLHNFRQTQTAFTARAYAQQGIDLMHAPIPVLGSPNDIPYEMPIFQACAVVVSRLSGTSIDTACRLTHLAFFFGSCVMLYHLGKLLFGRGAGLAAVVLYLWSPLTIYWSRAALMEFMAVFFALGYAYTMAWMIKNRGKTWAAPIAITLGCLGALVKITTMATVAPLILVVYGIHLRNHRPLAAELKSRPLLHLAVVGSILVPIVIGQLWVWHADAIKASSPLTAWLTSPNLTDWNYGTLDQRLTLGNWQTIGSRIGQLCAPYALLGLAFASLLVFPKGENRRWLAYGVLAGVALPIVVFFNLYTVHDYYQCAIVPMVALACGVGLAELWKLLPSVSSRAVLVVSIALSLVFGLGYVGEMLPDKTQTDIRYVVGTFVRDNSSPDDAVIVKDDDWNPSMLYYTERPGMNWYLPPVTQPGRGTTADLQAKVRELGISRIKYIIFQKPDADLMHYWKNGKMLRQFGPFYVVQVSDPVE